MGTQVITQLRNDAVTYKRPRSQSERLLCHVTCCIRTIRLQSGPHTLSFYINIYFKATLCSFYTLQIIASKAIFTLHWLINGWTGISTTDTVPPAGFVEVLNHFGCLPGTISRERSSLYSNTSHTNVSTSCLAIRNELALCVWCLWCPLPFTKEEEEEAPTRWRRADMFLWEVAGQATTVTSSYTQASWGRSVSGRGVVLPETSQ